MDCVRLDAEQCNGCKMCVQVCFVDVIRWDEVEEQPVVAYPDDCAACNACELACSAGCIEVVPTLPGPFPAPY